MKTNELLFDTKISEGLKNLTQSDQAPLNYDTVQLC